MRTLEEEKLIEKRLPEFSLEESDSVQFNTFLGLNDSDPKMRRFASRIVENLISDNALRPIQERVDVQLLDSLLREELASRNVDGDFLFAVCDAHGVVKLKGLELEDTGYHQCDQL